MVAGQHSASFRLALNDRLVEAKILVIAVDCCSFD